MNYTTKRIEEIYQNDTLVSVSFAVCVHDGDTGATREVSVGNLDEYLADKEGTIKALAVETAAGIKLPEVPEIEVVVLEEVAITKKEVDKKKVEITAIEAAEVAEAAKAEEETIEPNL